MGKNKDGKMPQKNGFYIYEILGCASVLNNFMVGMF